MPANRIENSPSFLCRMILSLVVLFASVQAWAHGLEIRMSPDGDRIIGQVVYEDGAPWFAETVTIDNLTAPENAQLTLTTDAAGGFSATGTIGHEYRITARDDTGHAVEMQVTLDGSSASNTNTGTTSADASSENESGGIPFYIIAGALLLLSIIPAKYLQKKGSRKA